jgi:hypothetical protein
MLGDLSAFDKIIITLIAASVAAIVHAMAYTAAEGALRPQRVVLIRGADVLAIAAALLIVRLWLPA